MAKKNLLTKVKFQNEQVKELYGDSIVATSGSAGFDLRTKDEVLVTAAGVSAAIVEDGARVGFKETKFIHTGVHVEIPEGYVGLIVPRSSTGLKGLGLKNTLGVIDSDYRGELLIAAKTHNGTGLSFNPGDKVAQLVAVPCLNVFEEAEELSETDRGTGGFGSTGEK